MANLETNARKADAKGDAQTASRLLQDTQPALHTHPSPATTRSAKEQDQPSRKPPSEAQIQQSVSAFNAELMDSAYQQLGLGTGFFLTDNSDNANSGLKDPFFDSALTSIALGPNGEAAIRQMIKPEVDASTHQILYPGETKPSTVTFDNPNESYLVTLPGDKTHPIEVTPADLKKYEGTTAATWTYVAETAFLKLEAANHSPKALDHEQALKSLALPPDSFPFNKPGNGVNQVSYGDCFFAAALESVASSKNGQQKIQDMISDNKDGSYTVTFPGARENPVKVTNADLSKYSTGDGGDWANIIETALLKMDNAKVNGGNQAFDWSKPNESSAGALRLLTGQNASDDSTHGMFSLPEALVPNIIQTALQEGEPITASSDLLPVSERSTGINADYYPKPGSKWPIVGDHQFSIIGYDAKSQTITLQNPWGVDFQGGALTKRGQTVDGITDEGDGKITMSVDTFERHFSDIDMAIKPEL